MVNDKAIDDMVMEQKKRDLILKIYTEFNDDLNSALHLSKDKGSLTFYQPRIISNFEKAI